MNVGGKATIPHGPDMHCGGSDTAIPNAIPKTLYLLAATSGHKPTRSLFEAAVRDLVRVETGPDVAGILLAKKPFVKSAKICNIG
jgi:hypothetical protein